MKKRTIFSRIAILNSGRKAFLDYLRNLAPQIVLLSFSLLAAYKSEHNPQHEDALMVIALLFLAAFAAACYANITLFYQDCFGENYMRNFKNYNTAIHRLYKIKRYSRPKRLIMVSWITFKHKWIELAEQAFTVGFLQITLLVLIYLAGQNYLHMLPATK